jgi:hypothetical protein
LSAEDFELRVDSKPQSLLFFEQVRAGSIDEEKQLTAARKRGEIPRAKLVRTPALAGDRERIIFFFVDDSHLTAEGLNRTRSVLTHFVLRHSCLNAGARPHLHVEAQLCLDLVRDFIGMLPGVNEIYCGFDSGHSFSGPLSSHGEPS